MWGTLRVLYGIDLSEHKQSSQREAFVPAFSIYSVASELLHQALVILGVPNVAGVTQAEKSTILCERREVNIIPSKALEDTAISGVSEVRVCIHTTYLCWGTVVVTFAIPAVAPLLRVFPYIDRALATGCWRYLNK